MAHDVLVVYDVPAHLIKQTVGLRWAGMWRRENPTKALEPTGVFRSLARFKRAYIYNPVICGAAFLNNALIIYYQNTLFFHIH